MMHHYTESGLDNVWLKNGYIVKKTPYGKAVAIADADSLHKLLAVWLTRKEGRLTGKEFRYLRGMLCLSQSNTARMLGVTEGAVSLWERTGKVPSASDTLMRLLALEKLEGDGKVGEIIDRVNAVDRLVNQNIVASERGHKWSAKAQESRPVQMAVA
jgi:DNA-binding transcriptional regulator YiaG